MKALCIIGKLFVLCFVLVLQWCNRPTEGTCLHPDHHANVYVNFSHPPGEDDKFPVRTVATYKCENGYPKEGFKRSTCQSDGNWSWSWTGNYFNCSHFSSSRCRSPTKGVLSTPLSYERFGTTCFILHRGIQASILDNLEQNCDTSLYNENSDGKSNFYIDEASNMCGTFRYSILTQESTKKILLAIIPSKTDLKWWERVYRFFTGGNSGKSNAPKCSYLYCYSKSYMGSSKYTGSIEEEDCDINQQYWICKHNISSCGIPSRTLNTIMNYSGIYVGDTTTYRCAVGYATETAITRHCQSDGLWSGLAPICTLRNCGRPNVTENVTFELKDGTTYRSWVHYTCVLPGQIITNRLPYRMCQANGNWEGEDPICESPAQNESSPTSIVSSYSGLYPGEEELLNTIIGIIGGLTFASIILMWAVLFAVIYRNKRKKING